MTERNRAAEQASAIESKFYAPAGSDPSFVTSRLEELWAKLFNHCVSPPQ